MDRRLKSMFNLAAITKMSFYQLDRRIQRVV